MKKSKVVHNREKCIGCHSCVAIAPQNWSIDIADGKAILAGSRKKKGVHVGDIFPCDHEDNSIAAEACPMKCIRIEG